MEENSLKTVDRALDVLECFITDTEELSFTELRKKTGFSKAATFRILQTLEYRGYIYKVENSGKYRLGNSSLSLGFVSMKNSHIIKKTNKALNELHKMFDQNTNIYMLTNDKRMCINQKLCSIIQKTSIEVGGLYPLYWGAAGLAILAYIDSKKLLNIFEVLESKSPGYVKRHNLNFELDKIRNEGIAVQLGNELEDISCISAPIFFKGNSILGCISVSGMKYLYPQDIENVKKHVMLYAKEISKEYGNIILENYNE